jgi:hypothetical protein
VNFYLASCGPFDLYGQYLDGLLGIQPDPYYLTSDHFNEEHYLVIPVLLLFLFRSSRARVVTCLS